MLNFECRISKGKWAILFASLFLATACNTGDSSSSAGGEPEAFTLYYTCDTRGHIEPCRCSTGMAGGISRRQAYIVEHQSGPYLLVDAGDITAGAREWEVLEAEFILKGYKKMGYHAVNVGHRELSLGLEPLKKLGAKSGLFVSANVQDLEGENVFEPYIVVTLGKNFRAGIIGVTGDDLPASEIGKGLKVIPPTDALSKFLPELKEKCDIIVLLAFLDEEALKAVAEQFYEIDLIVGGNVTQPSGLALEVNRSKIVFITDKGKAVGQLDLKPAPDGAWTFENDIVMLRENMKTDAKIDSLVQEFKQELKDREFQPHKDDEEGLSSITALRSKTANKYVGSEACKECHPKAYQIWSESKHRHAFETLETKDSQYSPKCLKCHTVGYMSSDGYINERLTPHLKDVGCEICHGRGDYEVKIRNDQEVPVKKVLMKSVHCTQCHNSEFSPNFEQVSYWKKIEHGLE